MGEASITLNLGAGGPNPVAGYIDVGNRFHQETILQTQGSGVDPVSVNAGNPLPVAFAVAQAIIGNIVGGNADGATAPVKIGAIYNLSPPTYASGNRVDLQSDANGYLKVNIAAGSSAGGTSATTGAAFPSVVTPIGALSPTGTKLQPVNLDAAGNVMVNVAAGSLQALTDNTSPFTASTTQGLALAGAYNDGLGNLTSGKVGIIRSSIGRQLRVVLDADTSGTSGLTPWSAIMPASPAMQTVKSSGGQIGSLIAININATPVYLHFFDVAGAVTLGSTDETYGVPVPGNTGGAGIAIPIPPGWNFQNKIQFTCSSGMGLADNTSVTVNSVKVALGYA